MHLLEIVDLNIEFCDTQPPTRVVKDLSLVMEEGEILGIVGESGSGKTQTALSNSGTAETPCGYLFRENPLSRGKYQWLRRKAAAADPRKRDRHDFSGTYDLAQSTSACGQARWKRD